MNGEKIENIPGAEIVREKMHNSNPGIPEISKVQVGAHCTLAVPVRLSHQGSPCHFCNAELDEAGQKEACPERAPIVGHFNKIFKLSAIKDGGETLILKRVG